MKKPIPFIEINRYYILVIIFVTKENLSFSAVIRCFSNQVRNNVNSLFFSLALLLLFPLSLQSRSTLFIHNQFWVYHEFPPPICMNRVYIHWNYIQRYTLELYTEIFAEPARSDEAIKLRKINFIMSCYSTICLLILSLIVYSD